MSYQALYRKYRPTNFEGMVGQEAIVRTLKNQIATGRISHAYLFCGTRGTGKTSTAKVFAKAINCLSPKDGQPRNECKMCEEIAQGRSMNVVEIDAASNNGVDNIREIREEVKYSPAQGQYKVYIIDEVHMLSMGAFNALLKTLEEPPAHVIFILATTDPQKVPATILSRCQRFDFRRINIEQLVKTMKKYLLEEQIFVEENALSYIARLADGSMRDCLSILDQCISFYYGEKITLDKVLDVVGNVDDQVFFDMVDALQKKDAARCLDIVEDFVMKGREVTQFVTQFLGHLRNLLIASTVSDAQKILDLSFDSIQRFQKQTKTIAPEELVYFIRTFSELSNSMRYAGNSRILLEVCLIKQCAPENKVSFDALAARISTLERQIQSGVVSVPQSNTVKQQPQAIHKPQIAKKPKAVPQDMQEMIKRWPTIQKELTGSLKGLLADAQLCYMDNECLSLMCDYLSTSELVQKALEQLQSILEKELNKSFELRVVTRADYEKWYQETYGDQMQQQQQENLETVYHEVLPDAEFI